MTTARQIIEGALTFGLNRLSPGETLDADTGALCLSALNTIADEFNGGGSFLFREITSTSAALSSAYGTLSATWSLTAGTPILGAHYTDSGLDHPLSQMTFAQYQCIADKTVTAEPSVYAHDGYDRVYLYPVPDGQTVTLRTKQTVSDFADLDTDYGMPKGYRAHLTALLAEKMAPTLVGDLSKEVVRGAAMARSALAAKNSNPAVLRGAGGRHNIITGP